MTPEAVLVKRAAKLFDVDGTLADVSSIRHYVKPTPERRYKDFEAFHRESVNVPAIEHVAEAARIAAADGFAVLCVTARRVKYARHTAMWLALNGIPSDRLYMRPDTDGRPDYEVKRDILARIELEYTIVEAWDDNPNVIALWNEHNIPVQIVPGWVSND